MITAVVDTHTLIWFLSGDNRLSDLAKQLLSQTINDGNQVAVSSISLVEIIYLAEKGRLAADWPTRIFSLFNDAGTPFIEVAVNLEIAKSVATLANSGIADMPDRIIAATANYYNIPLITRDRAITNSSVETMW